MRHTPFISMDRGTTLAEAVVVIALLGLMVAFVAPCFSQARRSWAMTTSVRRIWTLAARARTCASAEGRSISLVMERNTTGWECYLARDRDHDGVNQRDLERGRDEILGRIVELCDGPVRVGFLEGFRIPDPGGRGWLDTASGDPVRAGRGDIITFTSFGTATPASIYLTDDRARMRVIRVYGASARVRVLEWRNGWGDWRRIR